MSENNENEKIIIPVDDLFSDFEEHLSIKDNDRIFFSGKFGIGKTHFLNSFFNNKKEDYEVFHLFPVNYQINPNSDIGEFLKYDILVKLINENNQSFKENDFEGFIDFKRLFYIWGKDNFFEIFKTGIGFIPKLGRPLQETLGLVEKFHKFKENIEGGEKAFVEKYLKKVKSENILEVDYLSNLINKKIENIKGTKQSVLVLDDLDRIDPNHIFRILNIFSAHFDVDNKEVPNKFNFDKIILVGDFKNIESIFYHKYGKNTDFNGYFNKFFKIEIYRFDNDKLIESFVENIIRRIKANKSISDALEDSGYIKLFLEEILRKSIRLKTKEKINLRQLLKVVNFELPVLKKGIFRDSFISRTTKIIQFIDISIKILISVFDGVPENLINNLSEILVSINNYKGKNIREGLYEDFSKILLGEIIGEDLLKDSDWKNKLGKVQISIQESNIKIFYNLLLEYIKSEGYNKKNIYDYDR